MTLQKLAYEEDVLYSKVIDLYEQTQTDDTTKILGEIFLNYKRIHQSYADLSVADNEALKRGLFIQWYALTEPSYLTGISDLDETAENRIVEVLNKFIKADRIDDELVWMLNYYSHWNWVFERLESFAGFDPKIVNEQNSKLPDTINKEEMKLRGQMGKYWSSLTNI